jgi:SHS2 domain-containing protein
MSPFRILEHPADVGIEAWGVGLSEAFGEAAGGLMSLIVDLSTVATVESREVTVFAADAEQLLVRWLSEVLYLYDGEGFLGKEFDITEFTTNAIRGTVKGESLSAPRHRMLLDVKAVTYHQIAVEERPDSARVRVFLDI